MASAVMTRQCAVTGNQSFASTLCRGRVLSQASASLPSLTKQETECACGGVLEKAAIKFYGGLRLPSAFVSQ